MDLILGGIHGPFYDPVADDDTFINQEPFDDLVMDSYVDHANNEASILSDPPRCLLCGFRFKKGDNFITDTAYWKNESGPFSHRATKSTIGNRGLAYFENTDETNRGYVANGINKNWHRTDYESASYHKTCLTAAEPNDKVIAWRNLQDAFGHQVIPTATQDTQRRNRMQLLLAGRLPLLFPEVRVKLPPEIWDLVIANGGGVAGGDDSDDLLRRCAVETMRGIYKERNSCSAQLDLRKGAWAHYMLIDGVRYIQRLTHGPALGPDGPDRFGCVQILKSTFPASQPKTVLYALEDHLGIRQLVFATPDEDLSQLPLGNITSPWWRTLSFRPGQQLRAWSDGVKIRLVQAVDLRDDDYNVRVRLRPTLWRTPTPPSNSSLVVWVGPNSYEKPWEQKNLTGAWNMDCMPCNEPNITGYSVVWLGIMAVSLVAHWRSDSDNPDAVKRLYRDVDGRCDSTAWNYFPVAKGERLTEMFMLRPSKAHPDTRGLVIIFQTSRGRSWANTYFVEDDMFHNENAAAVEHICSLDTNNDPGKTARIHYNISPVGNIFFAFENAGPFHHLPPLPLPRPSYWGKPKEEIIGHLHQYTYTCSSVNLDGVLSVTLSYKWNKRTCRTDICGLLFRYANEAHSPPAVLGEYRLDNVGAPIDLTDVDSLYIGVDNLPETVPVDKDGFPLHPDKLSVLPVDEADFDDARKDLACVTKTRSDRDLSRPFFTWYRLPLSGMVDMWYSHRRGIIYSPTMVRLKTFDANDAFKSAQGGMAID